jgi:hypothetical protein
MSKIEGKDRDVRELLDNKKYAIDYYQRDYRWQEKNILELLDDLEYKFMDNYEENHGRSMVEHYDPYFLGSIVISRRDGKNYLIDGQQRLTSLTLLLIYLHNLQKGLKEQGDISDDDIVDVKNLIFSAPYGVKSFNLEVTERNDCMEALFYSKPFDAQDQPESVKSIVARYHDIEDGFPDTLRGKALPFFVSWLLGKVIMVEITAYSDDDTYTITHSSR